MIRVGVYRGILPRPMAGLLVAVLGLGGACGSAPDSLRPHLLKVWHDRILENKGVSTWNAKNDGKRVFQEWLTLLEMHRKAPEAERRRVGRMLENYVVDNNLHPLAELGTSVPLPWYKAADFDMALLGSTSLMGLFQHDTLLLTHKTLLHLIKNITRCWGQEPKHYFEVLTLKFRETENHVFMIESIRYLTNQFIWENPRNLPELDHLKDSLQTRGIVLNNEGGRLRTLLLKQMQNILKKGLFEFNARVYQRFTLHALNNLYTFSSDSLIARGAACVLDYMAAKFAFQSYQSLRLGPYRRNAEHYLLDQPWTGDFACSFFAVQSGEYPWPTLEGLAFHWRKSPAHSSTALYAAFLGYRAPPAIRVYLENPPGTYWARMETKHRVNRKPETSPEQYFKSPHFLISMGGRYKFYRGANFPIAYSLMMRETPWVYDVIAQSSSVVVGFGKRLPKSKSPPVFKFKGKHWKHKNLEMYQNFIYGYALRKNDSDSSWPQEIPPLSLSRDTGFTLGRFDFRVLDLSNHGLYLILTKLHHPKSFWRHGYEKYNRGTMEAVDTAWTEGWESLVGRITSFPESKADKYRYPLWNGGVARLNPKHTPHNRGIIHLEIPAEDGVRRIHPEGDPIPLMAVWEWDSATGQTGRRIAGADGRGRLWVKGPDGGNSLEIDFQAWWHPRRTVSR